MCENIKVFKFDNKKIYNQDFYNLTKLNLMYDRKKIFSIKKNKVIYSSYFPFEQAKEFLNFNGFYLSAFVKADLDSNDYDFDIGFNNLEYDFEENLLNEIKNNYKDIYIIVKLFNPKNDYQIVQEIESNYNIVFSSTDNQGIYIIKFKENNNLFFIKKYVYGYLICKNSKNIQFSRYTYNSNDLKFIQELVNQVDIVVYRIPLYSNYNLIIYSKKNNIINDLIHEVLKLSSNNLNITYMNETIIKVLNANEIHDGCM